MADAIAQGLATYGDGVVGSRGGPVGSASLIPMGERCRLAALGATFALLVAACAATEGPRIPRAAEKAGPERAAVSERSDIPDALASADTISPPADVACAVEVPPLVTLIEPVDGSRLWNLPIAGEPAGPPTITRTSAIVPIGWSAMSGPGLVAVDLDRAETSWWVPLDDTATHVNHAGEIIVVATRFGLAGVDRASGDVVWSTQTEFELRDVAFDDQWAYAIDAVGVHAVDLVDGEVRWHLPVDRPDRIAADDGLLAVAAATTVIAVDTELQGILWEQQVGRAGAGRLHIAGDTVVAELSPAAAPTGGAVAHDRVTGNERWRRESIDDFRWTSPEQLITSRVPADSSPGEPYEIMAIDAASGSATWSVPASASAEVAVVGTAANRLLIADPHPGSVDTTRLRFLDSTTGELLWERASTLSVDAAVIDLSVFVTLVHTGRPSVLALVAGDEQRWIAGDLPEISSHPVVSPAGLVTVTASFSGPCPTRRVGSPDSA